MVEHYAAYRNFEDNIKFTEKMFDYLFEKLNLPKKVMIKNKL
jgi:lysyl-tRNA synthetase class 2